MTQTTKDSRSGNEIIIAVGSKDNAPEDIHTLSRQWSDSPEVDIVGGKEIRGKVVEIASALFLKPDFVLVLVDPDRETLQDLKPQMRALKERTHVIIYLTAPPSEGHRLIEGKTVVLEQRKERRIEDRVRAFIRKYDKKMTLQALRLLTNRIKDESIIDMELMKIVNYVGERGEIRSKDILAVGTETHEESLITLFDAFAKKDRVSALAIFENLLSNGLHVLAIHSFLTKQIRLLLHAKDMEEIFRAGPEYSAFAKTFGKWKDNLDLKPLEKKHYLPFQKPYYAFNLSKTSQKISKRDLIAFFDMLAALDLSIKTGTKYERVRLEEGLIGV
jgi:DNA polymerase III delta subunit